MRSCSLIVAVIALALLHACKNDPYDPSHELSKEEQAKLLRKMVYYSTKLPPNGSDSTKFDSKFDWYYDRAAAESSLLKWYATPDPTQWYFLVSRMARSLTPMQEGIAGKVKLTADGNIADYEEVFRVWKMPADTLQKRGSMLFDRMVHGKDLTLFYPKYQADRYIELPTEGYYFDKKSKHWKSSTATQ
jgi:hypothetical protein